MTQLVLALVFLVLYGILHLLSRLIKLRWPMLATSESVWEHLKMGFWTYGLCYGGFWAITGRGSALALFVGSIFAVVALLTVYYSVVSLTGRLSRYPLALHMVMVFSITFLAGLMASVVSLASECLAANPGMLWVSGAIWAMFLFLFTLYTYKAPPLPLFEL